MVYQENMRETPLLPFHLSIEEHGLYCVLAITERGAVQLLHFSSLPFDENTVGDDVQRQRFRLVELQVSGEDHDDHHGFKHTGTVPGNRLTYQWHQDERNAFGRKLEIEMQDALTGLNVTSHIQFFENIPVVRCWNSVTNIGSTAIGLEYLSSFALTGLAKEGTEDWERKMRLRVPHNTWYGEVQWRTYSLPELGLSHVNTFSMKRLTFGSAGTWSTSQYLPMGYLENTESNTSLFWQIEHNGAWQWELSDIADNHLYLQLSGPTEQEHQWWKLLQPGETFTSVPVAVGATKYGFENAVGALTRYRRMIRRTHRDNEVLPVIFNDYMNSLNADPTTEKLLPLINAAAEVSSEYFCIDAGWYADGLWWDSVGEWIPSRQRFSHGLQHVLDYIKSKGMIPGLWLEIAVMGVHSPLATKAPDEWFFCRHGKRVVDHGRYQLDFRHPSVVAHANEVVDRLVTTYGIGYIKMDYNIDAGWGTEVAAESPGEGLLGHNRAYLAWLDSAFDRYPTLVIENCSSGGMRMDYALLSRHSIQSSSDQTDYRKYAVIAASCPTAVTPEQCAVWSYPLATGDAEEVIFNMVNAMLMRIQQSGPLARLNAEQRALVKEGMDYYKTMRHDIPQSLPFWPLDVPAFADQWVSVGLRSKRKTYLAVWRLNSESETCVLPLPHLPESNVHVRCSYPVVQNCDWQWDTNTAFLSVSLPQMYSARIFTFEHEE